MKLIPMLMIAALIVAILTLLVNVTGTGGEQGIIDIGQGYRTTCSVTIANPILRSSRISNVICVTEQSALCIGSLNVGAFADQGNLLLTINNKQVLKKWSCSESDYCDIDIAICTPDKKPTTATLKLRDIDNTILDEKTIAIN